MNGFDVDVLWIVEVISKKRTTIEWECWWYSTEVGIYEYIRNDIIPTDLL